MMKEADVKWWYEDAIENYVRYYLMYKKHKCTSSLVDIVRGRTQALGAVLGMNYKQVEADLQRAVAERQKEISA